MRRNRDLPQLTPQQIERFWSKVEKRGPDECWPWMAGRCDFGYGEFWLNQQKRSVAASRIAYFLATNDQPGSLHVLHSCDNPPCCNPAHLRKGAQAENVDDAKRRQRLSPPPRNTVLTEDLVYSLRHRAASGMSYRGLAREIGVSHQTVLRAVKGIHWKHVA